VAAAEPLGISAVTLNQYFNSRIVQHAWIVLNAQLSSSFICAYMQFYGIESSFRQIKILPAARF